MDDTKVVEQKQRKKKHSIDSLERAKTVGKNGLLWPSIHYQSGTMWIHKKNLRGNFYSLKTARICNAHDGDY